MSITTNDGLIAGMSAGQVRPLQKASLASKAAGSFQSLWKSAGLPAAGANPGSANGAICDNTTVGCITYTNPVSGNGYVAGLALPMAIAGTAILYDRLWACSTLNGTLTTAQAIVPPALTRYAGGVDNELWIEVYAATGATAVTATISYTNQAGVAGRSGTAAIPATTVVGQMIPVTLQTGDTGVQSAQSVTLSASTLTAGDFGLTILHRLAQVATLLPTLAQPLDAVQLGMPQIQNSACLALMVFCSTTSTGQLLGSLSIAQG